jgi:hypothetical protein
MMWTFFFVNRGRQGIVHLRRKFGVPPDDRLECLLKAPGPATEKWLT